MIKIRLILIFAVFILSVLSCNNDKTEANKQEETTVQEDEISDEEFEKEMQQLDEDVENMDTTKK